MPEEVKLADVGLARLVFLGLGVVQVKSGDFTYEEGLDVGVVATVGDGGGLTGDVELALLVVEALHEDEQILVEVAAFLAQLALYGAPVAFGHFHPAAPLSPVEQRDFDSDFHYLIVFQGIVGVLELSAGAGKADLGEKVDTAQVAAGFGYLIIRFQLTTEQIFGELVVGQRLVE